MGTVKTAAGDVSRLAGNLNASVVKLNSPDGALDRLSDSTRSLSQAVDSLNTATLPRLNRVADDTSRTVRRLGRAADSISDNPQMLLFGTGSAAAAPGEPGFSTPSLSTASP
jgi:phospholipid/cholesterol/gamma-HCH transport system substrate-binding protein